MKKGLIRRVLCIFVFTLITLATFLSTAPTAHAQTQSSCNSSATYIGVDGNNYNVQNNAFNLNSGAQQCITVNTSNTSWSVTSNASVSTSGAPSGYPSIYAGCHWGTCSPNQQGMPIKLSSITSAISTWNVSPSPNGNWDNAYDIWTNANSTTNNNSSGMEIMIWINHLGSIQPAGTLTVSNISINGMTWNLWVGGGTNTGTKSYVATSGVTSVNFDLNNFFKDLENRGYLSTGDFLIDVEAGTEIWTAGSGFATNSFSVSINGNGGGGGGIPPAPTGLTASAQSSSQINLSWLASSGASSYTIFRSTTNGFTPGSSNQIASGVTATSFMDTGLQPSTVYYYKVEAVNGSGSSGPSNQASATTSSGCSTPPAPGNLSANAASANQINLSWNASSGAASYTVFRSTTNNFTASSSNEIVSGITTTAYSDASLTPSTTYYYRVDAVDSCGDASSASNQASAMTLSSSTSGTAHSGTFSLKATLSGSPSYTNTSQVANVVPNSNYAASIWIVGTGSVQLYVDNGNWGSNITSVQCTASSTWTQCTTPTFSTGGDTQITYILQDSYAAAGTVYLDDTSLGVAGQTNVLTNPDFESGNTGWNISSGSVWSIGQFSGSCGVPAAPSSLTASAKSSGQIGLSWATSSCATSYLVFRSTISGFTPSQSNQIASGVSGTTFTDSGLAASTTYFYLVEAVDSSGSSAPSNQASATTQPACTPPNPATGLSATAASSTSINLSWTASTTPSVTYRIFRSTTSGFTPSASNELSAIVTGTSFTDTGLNPNTTYFYVVEAEVSCGDNSTPSNQGSATTPASSSACHDGTWCVKGSLPSSQNWSNISEVVSAASSKTYVASMWIQGSGSVQIEVKAGNWGANITSVQCTASSGWTPCSTPSFSTGSNTQLTFIVQDSYAGAGTVLLDTFFLGVSGQTNVLNNPSFESGNVDWSISNSSTWSIGQF